MPLSLNIDLEMVPSLLSKECLARGEDFLDEVSISDSPSLILLKLRLP